MLRGQSSGLPLPLPEVPSSKMYQVDEKLDKSTTQAYPWLLFEVGRLCRYEAFRNRGQLYKWKRGGSWATGNKLLTSTYVASKWLLRENKSRECSLHTLYIHQGQYIYAGSIWSGWIYNRSAGRRLLKRKSILIQSQMVRQNMGTRNSQVNVLDIGDWEKQ